VNSCEIPQYNIIFYNINIYYKQKRLLLIKTNLTKSSYIKENIPEDAVVSEFDIEDFTGNVMDVDKYLHLVQIEQWAALS
jgi:hypothetical protein